MLARGMPASSRRHLLPNPGVVREPRRLADVVREAVGTAPEDSGPRHAGLLPVWGTLEEAYAMGFLERCGPRHHRTAVRGSRRDLLALWQPSYRSSRL